MNVSTLRRVPPTGDGPSPAAPSRVAVIGSGISGLATAWLLSRQHDVVLFEAASRLGGHSHTVDVRLDGTEAPVDTGFLVFNQRTYPHLCALFDVLGVQSIASEMSFALSLESPDLEWAGSSLATVFGQTRNLVRPPFWRMLADILRFNRESVRWLEAEGDDATSLGWYLARNGYSAAFRDWYLLPMAAAIWSCPTGKILDYPLATFVRFCRNHGLLQIFDRPVWRTVRGGAREYVRRLASDLPDIRLASPVRAVRPVGRTVWVVSAQGSEPFDQVVLACHSDQALALLGEAASPAQQAVLGAIPYEKNRAVLHSDPALLPRNRALWSAWNYLATGNGPHDRPVGVSYLINRLQPLPFASPVVVSLNPPREPDPAKVIGEYEYEHPVFDARAPQAQRELAAIQGQRGLWFCGAWGGYGFHEDGLASALRVANGLGVRAPWQDRLQPATSPASAPELRVAA